MENILDEYLVALNKYKIAKQELKEAETRLGMECRKIQSSPIINEWLKKLATILLDKLT